MVVGEEEGKATSSISRAGLKHAQRPFSPPAPFSFGISPSLSPPTTQTSFSKPLAAGGDASAKLH